MLWLIQDAIDPHTGFDWLKAAKGEWHFQAVLGMTGCVEPSLDEHLIDDERRLVILQIVDALASRTESRRKLAPALG